LTHKGPAFKMLYLDALFLSKTSLKMNLDRTGTTLYRKIPLVSRVKWKQA